MLQARTRLTGQHTDLAAETAAGGAQLEQCCSGAAAAPMPLGALARAEHAVERRLCMPWTQSSRVASRLEHRTPPAAQLALNASFKLEVS